MAETTPSVKTEGLAWGVRASFRRYVQRIARGDEIPDGEVGLLPDGRFHFPIGEVSTFDHESHDAMITFSGGVRFLGHAGFIDLRLGELSLRLDSGAGMLRTSSRSGEHDLVEVRVADVSMGDEITSLLLASRLAPGGEALFDGVYAAATPFDDLEIRVAVEREGVPV